MQAEEILGDKEGVTIVVCGDTPLIRAETMEALFKQHEELAAKATILTAKMKIRQDMAESFEMRTDLLKKLSNIKMRLKLNVKLMKLILEPIALTIRHYLRRSKKVSNENVQGEYYLPDVIEIIKKQGEVVTAYQTNDFEETLGVNDRVALAEAERIMRIRINENHMRNGVTIIDPANTYIEADVQIGQDTIIYPGTMIKRNNSYWMRLSNWSKHRNRLL